MEQWRADRQRSTEKKKTFWLKHPISLLYRFFLLIMILVLLQSVVKNIWMAKVLSDNQKKVQTMKNEKASLIQQLEESRTEFFVEKIAREKLDMLKSGEIILKLQSDK